MTEQELIDAERRAVDQIHLLTPAQRKRLYAAMRRHSLAVRKGPMPNDVSVSDAWLALCLRAKDLAGVSAPNGWYAPTMKR